jgi:PAS domain S-box-containing protein
MDITDRNTLDPTSLLHRDRLAAVIELATDGMIVIDTHGRIRLFNAAAERLFGCRERDATGALLERFIPPRLHAAYRAGMGRWRRTEAEARDIGLRSISWGLRTTGEKFPCEVSIAECQVGSTQELVIGVRDLTEQRRSARATRLRVEFERFLFDLSKTFLATPEESIEANIRHGLARIGRFLDIDRVSLMEVSQDRTAMTVVYAWDRDATTLSPVVTTSRLPWWLRRVLRGEVSLASRLDDLPEEASAEKEHLRQRGVKSVASIPLNVSGEIAGAVSFLTSCRQVSWTPELVNQLRAISEVLWNALKRHQAMEALLAARESARESEDRFRRIANTAPVMIWISDIGKQVTYVNQPWLDFTGWPPNEIPGHRWISLIHPDDVEMCGDVYVKAFDQRKPFVVEHRLRRRDGEYRWTVTEGVPRCGSDGTFIGYAGTAVDITERKLIDAALLASHEALQERTVELERRTTQLSRMASDLTLAEQRAREELAQTLHDGLQQLLVAASVNVDSHIMRAAQRGSAADELVKARNYIEEAVAAARTLSLELFPPVLQTAALSTALDWLADWSRSKYGLEVKLSANPRANSDRKDVRTLLFGSVRELLLNVVKHAQVDRVAVDLAAGPDDTLCITVADEGRGFDPTELEERAKASQVGWGLFSIRERLTLLGGRLDIESVPGGGAKFRLIAPRDSAHRPVGGESASSHAATKPPTTFAAATAPSYALRVLIVDDHPALRKTFAEILQARPEFQVVGEATNGLEAIAQAHVLRPDVVLMDVSMPEMDGIEATRRIHAELPFIRILGLSVYPRSPADPHPIELAGAEAFFTKGIDTLLLIDHLLDKHAAWLSITTASAASGASSGTP